jgi:hypothetical protein
MKKINENEEHKNTEIVQDNMEEKLKYLPHIILLCAIIGASGVYEALGKPYDRITESFFYISIVVLIISSLSVYLSNKHDELVIFSYSPIIIIIFLPTILIFIKYGFNYFFSLIIAYLIMVFTLKISKLFFGVNGKKSF